MKMIRVVWFIACLGKWQEVVAQELSCLQKSGLFEAAEEILVCLAGAESIDLPAKCRVVRTSAVTEFEFPALQVVQDTAQDHDKILYIHTKGVSRTGRDILVGDQWREYLLWGCVERWKEHVQALDVSDVSGVQLTQLDEVFTRRCGCPRVFGGNFWWARGEWIFGLPAPVFKTSRWEAEGWLLSTGDPKITELSNLTKGKTITNTFPFGEKFSRSRYDPAAPPEAVVYEPPKMVEHRWQIINNLISKFHYKRYLEIGLFQGRNFRHVLCQRKESIDPQPIMKPTYKMTSDEYFRNYKDKWDIVFIDGLHTEEQVLKDIENALTRLNKNGTIVIHDCNPETEWEQRDLSVYDGKGVWLGTVWKGFARLRMTRPDLYMAVIDSDFGCGIIRQGSQDCFPEAPRTFPFFVQNRKQLMNIIEPEDFWTWLTSLSCGEKTAAI